MTSQPIPLHHRSGPVYISGLPRLERRRRRHRILTVAAFGVAAIGASTPLPSLVLGVVGTALGVGAATPEAPAGEPRGVAPAGPDVGTGGLTPAMASAMTRARAGAAAAGVTLDIVSGHRDADTQQRLYEEAIAKYGSAAKARRWVLPPKESEHVRGRAVDIGPPAAAAWLEKHGAGYGLCRRYDNEPWHFELLVKPGRKATCPPREPWAGG